MPVVVSCQCGKRFAAKDHLVGKRVPCPACGNLLTVAAGPPPGIYVACACGRSFLAPESMAGRQAHCKGCGRVLQVPDSPAEPAPLDLTTLPLGPLEPLTYTLPSQNPTSEIPWDTLKIIAGWGAGLLAIVIIFNMAMSFLASRRELANAPPQPTPTAPLATPSATPSIPGGSSPASSSAPATGNASAPSSVPAPSQGGGATISEPPGNSPVSSAASGVQSRASISPKTTDPAEAAVVRLPQGIQDWHNQPNVQLSGLHRRIDPTDAQTERFSWLTALLPFIGQGQVYEQFDFKQPMTKGKNLQLGGVLIPEYINPLDDHQRWKGYPFDNIALTHFVGISGIEDARNVVAAKLPRTDSRAGVFGYDEVARPEQITDGQSQTIMVAGAGALANPWTFGGGATIRGAREPYFDKSSGLGTKGLPGGGSIVVMADGSVRHVTANVDPKIFRAMCTIHGSDSVDLEPAAQPFDLKTLKAP
jgi:hypothetical protein